MKARVPFHYTVSFVLKRHLNKRSVYFASETEVAFRTVPREAVRRVMRLGKGHKGTKPGKWSFSNPFGFKQDGSLREVVKFEGNLWVEAGSLSQTVGNLEKNGGADTAFESMKLLQDTEPTPRGAAPTRIYENRHQVEMTQRLPLRIFQDDGGEQVRRKIARRAAAMIAIGDVLYARCREPVLKIGGQYQEKTVEFCRYSGQTESAYADDDSPFAYDKEYIFDHDMPRIWSMAESDVGRDEWLRTASEKLRSVAHFEIVDREALTACPHIDGFMYLSTQALHELWKNPLAMRPGVTERAVELRDALIECGNQITPRLRRAVEDVAEIQPMSDEEADVWRARAAARPRMVTSNGHHHYHKDAPLTRASQVVEHAENHLKAAEFATAALRRYGLRGARLSWEERALEMNVVTDDDAASYELLSSQAVAMHAEKIGVDPTEAIMAARDDGATIFALGRRLNDTSPSAIAIADRDIDGRLVVRKMFHRPDAAPSMEAIALLDRHLAEATPEHDRPISSSMEMAP